MEVCGSLVGVVLLEPRAVQSFWSSVKACLPQQVLLVGGEGDAMVVLIPYAGRE